MRDQTLLYWGMVVTTFLLIAAMLTARELIDMYFDRREAGRQDEESDDSQGDPEKERARKARFQ